MVARRKFSSEFKARVVREALKEQETTSELVRRFEVAPSQIIQWKKEALSQLESLFGVNILAKKVPPKMKLLFKSLAIASLVFASSVAS